MKAVKHLLDEIERIKNISGNGLARILSIDSSRYFYYKRPDGGRSGKNLKQFLRFIVNLWRTSGMEAKEFLEKLEKSL